MTAQARMRREDPSENEPKLVPARTCDRLLLGSDFEDVVRTEIVATPLALLA